MKAFVHQSLPGRVVFGAGTLHRVAAEVASLQDPQRVLVIASGSATKTGEHIVEALGSRHAAVFGEVLQHVPEDLAARAIAMAADVSADAVVTVGGGSAIGLGKVIAVDRGIPVVAVPTTYSGSEMTPVYGITGTRVDADPASSGRQPPSRDLHRKRTVRDLRALPSVVVYDPELTVGLPRRVTASSGFNALAHCVEGFYAPGASPVVDLWAEEAIASLAEALPELADDPSDLGARSDALYGAYLAGATLAVAGTALHHKLCHVLGGTFGLDHGDVHAVLLPHVAAFNADAAPERLASAAAALRGQRDAAQVGGRLHDLALRIGAPTSLAEIGMPAEGLAEAAALGVAAVGDSNPCPVDEVAVRRILDAAYEGRSP